MDLFKVGVGVLLAGCLIFSADAMSLCIKTVKANLRMGPGTEHEISWEVARYMPFRFQSPVLQWLC